MGIVAKEVKQMSQEDILAFEKAGEATFGTHCLKLADIKVRTWVNPLFITFHQSYLNKWIVLSYLPYMHILSLIL